MEIQEKHIIKTFGRRHGKRLTGRQQSLVDNSLPAFLPKTDEKAGILEIGFGGGEHLMDLANQYPDKIIVGAEPFINGVASLMGKITDEKNDLRPEYKNIRLFPDDVRLLLNDYKNKFQIIYVLHPDPWPKARHEKRRLLNSEFLNLLENHLAENGEIIIGTDHYEYYDWVLTQLKNTKLKIKTDISEIIKTRYQEKNKANTAAPKYLVLSN